MDTRISRRAFVVGGAASAVALGATLSGCKTGTNQTTKTTKSGIDPKNFETDGIYTFNTGITKENVPSSAVPTKLYTITNKNGAELCVTNVGARLVSLMVPDKNGELVNTIIGFDNLKQYVNYNEMPNNFYGAIVGRFGNRIGKGQFTIDGQTYQVDTNEKGNMLHGGKFGWHYQTFTVEEYDPDKRIKLKLVSPDGDMGFPGEVTCYLTYTLNENNTLGAYYELTSTKPTVINVSNHSYWDVSGDPESRIVDDELFLCGNKYTKIDQNVLTTGEIETVSEGNPFDFFGTNGKYYKKGKKIGKDINANDQQIAYGHGYDHNWGLFTREEAQKYGIDYDGKFEITDDGSKELDGKGRFCLKNHSDVSGITMTVTTTEVGVQFYDGYDLDGTLSCLGNKKVNQYAAIALEPQHFPDWPNHSNFESNYLRPGETLKTKTEYKFTTE